MLSCILKRRSRFFFLRTTTVLSQYFLSVSTNVEWFTAAIQQTAVSNLWFCILINLKHPFNRWRVSQLSVWEMPDFKQIPGLLSVTVTIVLFLLNPFQQFEFFFVVVLAYCKKNLHIFIWPGINTLTMIIIPDCSTVSELSGFEC